MHRTCGPYDFTWISAEAVEFNLPPTTRAGQIEIVVEIPSMSDAEPDRTRIGFADGMPRRNGWLMTPTDVDVAQGYISQAEIAPHFITVCGDVASSDAAPLALDIIKADAEGTPDDGACKITERETVCSFWVGVPTPPRATLTCAITSLDATEGRPMPSVVTFEPGAQGNWTPRMVAVGGVRDWLADGDMLFSVRVGPCSSADARFDGFASDVSFVNHHVPHPLVLRHGPTESISRRRRAEEGKDCCREVPVEGSAVSVEGRSLQFGAEISMRFRSQTGGVFDFVKLSCWPDGPSPNATVGHNYIGP